MPPRLRASGRPGGRRGRGGGPAGSGRRSAPPRSAGPSPTHGDRAWHRRSRTAAPDPPRTHWHPSGSSPAWNEGMPGSAPLTMGACHKPPALSMGRRRPAVATRRWSTVPTQARAEREPRGWGNPEGHCARGWDVRAMAPLYVAGGPPRRRSTGLPNRVPPVWRHARAGTPWAL